MVTHVATGGSWSVDGAAKFCGAVVAIASWRRGVFVVGIGTRNNDLERILILSKVCCFIYGYRRTPERTFVIGGARWVRAALGASIQARVSFNVHVESLAARRLIASGSASEGVVAGEGVETHVIGRSQGGVRVNENNPVPVWGGSCGRHC